MTMTHDEFLNVRVGDKIAACDDYGWPQSGTNHQPRQLLTKLQLYTVLVAKYDSDLVKIANDEQSEMWFDATVHFIIVTVIKAPVSQNRSMTLSNFKKLVVGNTVIAYKDYTSSTGISLIKGKSYVILMLDANRCLINVHDDSGHVNWFRYDWFNDTVCAQTTQPALGIPLLMTHVEFLKLVPGDVVTAAQTTSGITIGNKYTVTGLNANQDLLWINDDTGLQRRYRYERFASITSTYVFPKVSVKAKAELSEFELMKKDLSEPNSTEPACRCSSPQVHDSDCAWFKWRHNAKA